MTGFALRLQDANHLQEIQQVTSFVGEDGSGSFGLLPGHARMLTNLVIGLARFRVRDEAFTYLATPGAVLYFEDDCLTLSTRHYLLDRDYTRISEALQEQILAEEAALSAMKSRLHRLEEEVLKRMWEISRYPAEAR